MQKDQTNNEESKEEAIEEQLEEELDFTKPSYQFVPKGVHNWHQEGFYLVCTSCDLTHAVFIGHDRVIVGKDEKGDPIIKTRKEIGMV